MCASVPCRRPFAALLAIFILDIFVPVLSESYQSSSSNIRTKWVSNGCNSGATNITIESFVVNVDDGKTISARFIYKNVPSEKVNITAVALGMWGTYTILIDYEFNLCDVVVSNNTVCPDDGVYELDQVNLDCLGETLWGLLGFRIDLSLEIIFTLQSASSSAELGCSLMTLTREKDDFSPSFLSGCFGGLLAFLAIFCAVLLICIYDRTHLAASTKNETFLKNTDHNDEEKNSNLEIADVVYYA